MLQSLGEADDTGICSAMQESSLFVLPDMAVHRSQEDDQL